MKLVIGLPLTGKELIEQSARRRTYLLRVLAGLGLGLVAAMVLHQRQQYGRELLGQGQEVFSILAVLITWLPVVLAPALGAAAIASEREDGSLPLLLMTRLGPGVIILEKWLSRLIALVSLQLMALPLLALCYAVGGVREDLIWWTVLGAMAATAHATALTILASAWCRGTVGALFTGYGLILVSYITVGMLFTGRGDGLLMANAPAIAVFWAIEARFGGGGRVATAHDAILLSAIPITVVLLAARLALTRRSQAVSGNRLLAIFRRLDAWFEAAELRRFGRRAGRELPRDRPVAWRECNRRTLANPRYLTRILLPLGAIVVLIMASAVGTRMSAAEGVIAWTGVVIEVGLTLTMLVLGATVFTAERSAQTLEVLLTTPMTPREILAQKLSGLRRVHLAGAILLGLVLGIRLLVGMDALKYYFNGWSPWLALLSLALLPVTMGWLGLVIGLHVRSRAKAVGMAVAVMIAWTVAGGVFLAMINALFHVRADELWAVALIPSCLGVVNHFGGFSQGQALGCAIAFAAVQTCLWLVLRIYARKQVGHSLRRG